MSVNFTGFYSQTFDTLASTGTTNTTLPIGWVITEAGGGTRDNEQYAADDGQSSTGDTYSYGAAGGADRALGGLQSGTLIPLWGASFTNATGNPIMALTVSYTGEQWRLGAIGRVDRLDFQYSLDATSLTDGTWTDVNALDFVAPVTSGTVGGLDGNATANRTAITSTLTGLAIPNGATVWFRWQDLNAAGADDGLAIDDFSLSVPALSTFTVTNTNDSGPGSLRDAILSANADPNTADIITFGGIFSDGTPDVISLTTDQLSIAGSVTIDGQGLDGLTLRSNGNWRVLNIQSGTVVLNTLTLADGTVTGQGGGIFNNGTLSLLNSTILNNSASDDGAGILNNGSLTITNSTLRNNTAGDDGGGIRNNGTLTLINSTLSGNTATGASATSGGGGLLNVIGATATIINSTISGNTAPNGGGIRNDGSLTLQNVTITANVGTTDVGGVLNTVDPNTFANLGLTTLSNSIIAGNIDATTTPFNFPDVGGGVGSFTDGGNNLIGATNGFNSTVSPTTQSGTVASPLNPLLGPLANNGGPTQTHALLAGSPAIDQATTGTATDQRGVAANGTRDIGAFEATNGPITTVYVSPTFTGPLGSAIADADLGTAGNQAAVQGVDAFSTLAEALAAVSSDGSLIVNGGSYAETIALTDTRTLEITGSDVAQAVTIADLSTVVGTTLNLAGTSTLTLGDEDDRTLAGTIGGTGNWVKQGTGSLTVSGANTYTGTTTVAAGRLQVTENNALGTTAGTTTVASGATLNLRNVNYTTPETVILQGGSIANLAFGTITTFAGDVILAADSNFDHNSSTLVLTGAVTGNFLLNKRNAGNLRLTNTGNSFSRFNIAGGLIQLGASGVILDTADMSNFSTFDLNGFDETVDSLFGPGEIVNSQATLSTLTIGAGNTSSSSGFNGRVSGAISVIKTGTGRQVWGSGVSNYTGTTTINGGVLAVSPEAGGGAIQALGSTAGGTIVNAGGTLEFRNVAYALAEAVTLNGGTIRSQAGSSSFGGAITLTGASVINGAGTLTLTGVIGESGGARSLTFNEAGIRTLTAANTYTGATVINGGTLVVNGSLAAGSAVTVNNTGILTGDGAVNGAITIATGGTLRPGTTIGDLATGSLTFASGSTLAIDITGATPITQYDRLTVTGSVNLGNATLALVGGYTPNANESFTLIANDGADAVIGTFDGLAQGSVVLWNGASLVVNYSGGDGNDVTLTAVPPSVNLSVSSTTGSEADTTVITVTATASSAVVGNQTVAIGVSGGGITAGDYSLSNGGIITIADGATTGSITFTVVDDGLIEGIETAVLTLINPSPGLTLGTTTSQVITLTDNDTAVVIIIQSGGSTTLAEGGATDTYSVVLSSQPTANVTITINNDGQSSTNPTSLVFTPANWNIAQTVTVIAVDDAITEGNHSSTLTHSAASSDTNYNGITIASVTASITDNDTPPTTANASVTLAEDTVYDFSSTDFPFADADAGDTLQSIRVTQLPTAGQLFLDANGDSVVDPGEAVTVNQDIDVSALGQLKFRPVANANGTPYTSFQFQVSDGQFLSTTPGILTLNVSPVNDAPTGSVTLSGITQATYTLTADASAVQDIDGLNTLSYQWQQSIDGTTWSNIAGATLATFQLTAAQVGQRVRAEIRYVDGGNTDEVVTSDPTGLIRPFLLVPNFNGDTQADIAWRHRTAGRTSLWYMNGTSLASGELLSRDAGNIWELKAVDDFDRDGSTDLVWQNPNNNQAVIWLMDGNDLRQGILLPSDGMAAPQRDPNWQIVATGDFNSDDKADLLWRHRTSGENAVWFMDGTTRTGGVMLDRLANLDWEVGAVDDFTKNGEMEILWRHRVTGQNVVWFMDGTTRTGGEFIESVAAAWRMAGAADFNGDGQMDLLYRHRTTTGSAVWFMDGLTRTGGTLLQSVAVDWQPVV